MDWSRIQPWETTINSVATQFARRYRMLDQSDVKQALYLWFLTHETKLDAWEAIGPRDAKNLIYKTLRNEAIDYCEKEKSKIIGYEPEDNYYYDTRAVTDLLPSILRQEWSVEHPLSVTPTEVMNPAEGNDLNIMRMEIASAYDKLSLMDRQCLFLRYAEDYEFADIAKFFNSTSDGGARMRHKRAVNKLIKLLGGVKVHEGEE